MGAVARAVGVRQLLAAARADSRGDRFENVCFMGNPEQLLADSAAVEQEVRKLGLSWRLVPRQEWHDYRQVDAILAIRPVATADWTSKEIASVFSQQRKPASKLYNAWLAGVPAILSPEIAYQDLRQSPLDYLEAATIPEAMTALAGLQRDPARRRAMRDNGRLRAREFTAERTTAEWRSILERRVIPRYARWKRSRWPRVWLGASRRLLRRLDDAV
jgi:hypothetical protein